MMHSASRNPCCIIFLLFLFCACKQADTKREKYPTIIDKIQAKSAHYDGVSISSNPYISEETIAVIEKGHHFLIPARKNRVALRTCAICHSKPLPEMRGEGLKRAHWNIDLHHADSKTMRCTTCHDPGNPAQLRSLTGNPIDFNKSYRLCSQCHAEQFEDWAGGAHGKSAGGWAPPRVSMTCVNCHNPHAPRFGSRWPTWYNTRKAVERK